MFTGIIQNQAKVALLKVVGGRHGEAGRASPSAGRIRLGLRFIKNEKRKIKIGESIAVDGTCLTVAKVTKQGFEADVVRETLKATTLSQLKIGSRLNTERALRYGDPLGGHFVTGHVDARGRILGIENKGKNRVYIFSIPPGLETFIAAKGSVVVDGISLTIQAVKGRTFKIAIVPHTWKVTTLGRKKPGDEVNLEADLIARYLGRIQELSPGLEKIRKKPISRAKLLQLGF